MDTRGSLAAVPTLAEPPQTAAATRPVAHPCSKCGQEPRDPGQRWGRRCRTVHKREARRLARMRRLTGSTEGHSTPSHWSHQRGRGAGVRLAALEAAAATLLSELEPPSREGILAFAEEGSGGDRGHPWEVIVSCLDWCGKRLTPAPRST